MSEEPGVCSAFVATVAAISKLLDKKPLPAGLNVAENDDWKLAVNNGREPVQYERQKLQGWDAVAMHKEFFVIATFNPLGGMIGGGMPEGDYIAEMEKISGGAL